jgi:hypothetical protein
MGYCEIHIVRPNGDVVGHTEFRNQHRGTSVILNHLCKRYFTTWENERQLRDWHAEWDRLVREYKSMPLRWYEWNSLMFAYDYCIVRRDDMPLLARSLRRFAEDINLELDGAHLPGWASLVERIYRDEPEVSGVCIYATSVSDNPWQVWPDVAEDKERESRRYNVTTDTNHWFAELRAEKDIEWSDLRKEVRQ